MFISKSTSREMLACAPVLFNQFLIGLSWGWTAPMLVKLQKGNSAMSINQEEASWVASIHEIGRVTGPFISPFIVDNLGRKYSLILVTILLFLIWPSQIYIHDVYLLCFVRLLFGVTNGISDVVVSVYVTENCLSEFRSVMAAGLSILFNAGFFFELVVATLLSYRNTAIANSVISICAFSASYFSIESPSFLIVKEKYDKAEKNLAWLRGDEAPQKISNELEILKRNVQQEKLKKKSLKTLFSSTANVKSLGIVLTMYAICSASGSTLSAYIVMIFQPAKNVTPYQFTYLNQLIHFIAMLTSPIVVSKNGRRSLLIVGFSLIGLCHLSTFMLFYLHNRNYEILFFPWLIFLTITLFGCIGAVIVPALFALRTELLPLSVRSIGATTAVVSSSVVSFCVTKVFLPINERFGMEANFFLFAVMGVLLSVFVYFAVPETRGKTSVEVQASLEKRKEPHDVIV